MLLAAAFVLAALVGLTLGLFGGGGSLLTLPLFVYVLGVDERASAASSLFVVGVTSLAGAVLHAREGNVRARAGTLFGAAAMAGAFAGGAVAHRLPSCALLVAFASVMVAAALAMGRRAKPETGEAREDAGAPRELAWPTTFALGAGIGGLSGLIGAGGGLLLVPALVLAGGLPTRSAVGTSLLVLAMQSLAGFAGHLAAHAVVPWTLVGLVAAGSVAGSVVGAHLAGRVSTERLRRAFAGLVLLAAAFVLSKQIEEPSCTSKPSTTPSPPP